MSLAGEWQFQLDPAGEFEIGSIRPDRKIRVPLPWQAAFPELRRYSGYAWYRRSFDAEGALEGGDLRLRFGAVDYWCEVFLNGARLGEHEGGYTPFECSLREALRDGRNELVVRVFDPIQSEVSTERWPDFEGHVQGATDGPPFAAAHVPHGKQDWYVNTGGIWQDVTLTPRGAAWIDRLHITPDLGLGGARVELAFAGELERVAGTTTHLEVRADGAVVATASISARRDRRDSVGFIAIPGARMWTPESPFLYELVATVSVDGRPTSRSARFGMRSFAGIDGRFVLNGERLHLRAVLDQDFYPETVSAVPSADYLRDQFAKVKRLGFNCVRCHVKVPDPTYLDLADEIGLLVWEELPSWRTYWSKGSLDPAEVRQPVEERRRVEETLDAVIERDLNHPSVVIRTLVNEDWGTALPFSADDRRWLVGLYDRCKRLDPTRLVVDNSACAAPWGTNFHVKTDIDDFHTYATIPDQAARFTSIVSDLALRPLWTYSPHGDGQRRGDEPVVLSEFGNWGLPTMAALTDGTDRKPDWFDVRPWHGGWDQEPGVPAGVLERFRGFGLGAIWDGFDALAIATQEHQLAALRFQIEVIRRTPSIAGYVVTELTDTYWECNGILDFARRPKRPADEIAAFNRADVLVATPDRRSYRSASEALVEVHASIFSSGIDPASRIEARIDGQPVAATRVRGEGAIGDVAPLGSLRVKLPIVDALTYVPITVALVGPDLERVATDVQVAVVPPDDPAPIDEQIGVFTEGSPRADGSSSLVERLTARGYRAAANALPRAGIVVSSTATPALLDWVRAGGRLLFLAEHRSPFYWLMPCNGSAEGWITSYSWIRRDAHKRLNSAIDPLGLEFVDIIPERTIAGLQFDDPSIHDDVLAGMVVGWVHHPTAHTLRFRFGRGLVVMTTFRLRSNVGLDPIAGAMFDDLIEHLASEGCRPVLTANR